jgi:hypothetical protein
MPIEDLKKEITLMLKASKRGMTWQDLLESLKERGRNPSLERVELEDILLSMKPQVIKSLGKDERGMFREYWMVKG